MNHTKLIEACKSGDRRAQNDLYRHFAKPAYNTIIRMVGNGDDAQELLQQSFIKVFRNLGQFEGEGHPGGWIKRIAITTTLNFLNRRKITYELEDHHASIPAETFEEESRISAAKIHEAIKTLPGNARVIFTLHLLEGYRHTEIAEMLEISASTSRSQYMRAKQLLRDKLTSTMTSA